MKTLMKMKASMRIGSLSSAVAVVVIVAMAGLLLSVRMTGILTPDGSQQVKEKPTHDADWALEITGNSATAFRFEMDHGITDDDNVDDLDNTFLSAPAQSPLVKVAGISELAHFSFWGGNGFCKVIKNLTAVTDANMSSQPPLTTHQSPTLPVVVNFTFGCKELFRSSNLGTGNWLSSF
jgi:hypothetical protein